MDTNGLTLRVGDAVMWASSIACGHCIPCRAYREPTLCETRRTYGVNRSLDSDVALSGAWGDYIYLREGTTVVRVPDGVDHLAAMSLACAGPTMVHAYGERRAPKLGETVVVQGSGPVGLAAAALAQLAGARRVILVGGPSARLEAAKRAGFGDEHFDITLSSDPGPVLEAVRAATGGRGADLVVECAGVPDAIAQGISLCRRGGSYLIVGQYTDAGDTTFNPHQIVFRQLEIYGSWAFSGTHVVEYVGLLPRLLERFALGSLVASYPLEACNDAMAAVGDGSVMKAVLRAKGVEA
jgi:threonine dehydrogenase-like Zn-dependent dehydrogenase